MFNQVPFAVTEIGWIRFSGSHAPKGTRSRPAHASFLDTL
jgi:hypothetical protein